MAPTMFKEIDISTIESNGNVRSKLDIDTELVSSIKAVGVIQPVTVAPRGDGYVVVHGHRRVAAAKRAGLETVPAMVKEDVPEDADRLVSQLVENLQRKDLPATDEAQGVLALTEHISQKEIAASIGRSEAWVSQRRKLANAPKIVRKWLDADEVTLETAIASSLIPASYRSRIKPAVEADHYGDKERAVKDVLRSYRHDVAVDAAEQQVTDIKAEGHAVCGSGEFLELHPQGKYIREKGAETWHYDAIEVDMGSHMAEDCHIRVVSIGQKFNVQIEHACTTPTRHKVAGGSDVKAENAIAGGKLSDDEKLERKAIREARKVFNAQVHELIAKPNKTQTRLLAVQVAVDELTTHVSMGAAAKMLGLDPGEREGFYKWPETFREWADGQEPEAVLLALLFGDAENNLVRGGSRHGSGVTAGAYADGQDVELMDAVAMLKVLKQAE
jgi:ParB/RepB/Spo0J family partition protein